MDIHCRREGSGTWCGEASIGGALGGKSHTAQLQDLPEVSALAKGTTALAKGTPEQAPTAVAVSSVTRRSLPPNAIADSHS
jgi:hypothetical protein